MEKTLLDIATRLSDDELVRRVGLLATRERDATVELVVHLAELDTRQLYLAHGYSSLFSYCTEVLRLAEHAAYNRIEAARASRRFPAVLDRLAGGSLNLSTLRLLAPHLTPENHASALADAAGKSKREVELLVAALAPRPDVPASVRRLPLPRQLLSASAGLAADTSTARHVPAAACATAATAASIAAANTADTADTTGPGHPAHSPAAATDASRSAAATRSTTATEPTILESDGSERSAAGAASTSGATAELTPPGEPTSPSAAASAIPTGRPLVAPLSPERYRVQFTVGRETHERRDAFRTCCAVRSRTATPGGSSTGR